MTAKPIEYQHGYRVVIRVGGRQVKRKFPSGAYSDPKAAALDFIRQAERGEVEDESSLVPAVVERYLLWSDRIQKKSPNTLRCDRQRLGVFARFHPGPVNRISIDTMREFQEWFFAHYPFNKPNQRRGGNPHATWEKYRQNLSAFFNWCAARKLIPANPLARQKEFKIKLQKNLPKRIFTAEELALIFAHVDQLNSPSLSAAFRLLAYTGMRPGEARRLKWADVDLESGVIRVTKSKAKNVRSIPISGKLRPYLEALPRFTYVLDNGHGEPLYTDSWYWKILRQATDAAGIPPGRIYDLRHTFAASLAMAGVPIPTIQELMGHENIQTTMIYIHFSPRHLKGAIDALPF